MPHPHRPRWLLPVLVAAQLLATSIWFAPNAVMVALEGHWAVEGGVALVTSAVQTGFIAGTLSFALLGIADRFHASNVFFACALAGAAANLAVLLLPSVMAWVLVMRFAVGFALAGIYPVGMRIAAGWYPEGLGRALGFLVGALVLGTASPHLFQALSYQWDWRVVIFATSSVCVLAGLAVWRIPEGTHLARGRGVRFGGVLRAFRSPDFRASAFGYFGHMWELYAFWAFLPVWVSAYGFSGAGVSWVTFAVMAAGGAACMAGGVLGTRVGAGPVAWWQLAVSGAMCLLSPWLFEAPAVVFLLGMLVWGATVAGDSPQFSALNARSAPRELVGSALTLANCVGFAITIASINLLELLDGRVPPAWLLIALAPGPALGLVVARRLVWVRPPPA